MVVAFSKVQVESVGTVDNNNSNNDKAEKRHLSILKLAGGAFSLPLQSIK